MKGMVLPKMRGLKRLEENRNAGSPTTEGQDHSALMLHAGTVTEGTLPLPVTGFLT